MAYQDPLAGSTCLPPNKYFVASTEFEVREESLNIVAMFCCAKY